ncbi:MAG TPA: thioredoxin [Elusimicrobiales bacterium]|nr:thioredoxin [Elusimicrobiales bacterium]
MQIINTDTFKAKVFDFARSKEWKFAGERPCIVDFYADWCGPCKMLAPVLEELSEKYAGKLDIYKVNTDQEQELAASFGIQSIPSLLFVPMTGKPQMAQGLLPKEELEKVIGEVLGVV